MGGHGVGVSFLMAYTFKTLETESVCDFHFPYVGISSNQMKMQKKLTMLYLAEKSLFKHLTNCLIMQPLGRMEFPESS